MKDKEKYYHLIWPITNEQGNIFYGHDKFFFETLQLSKKRAKNRDIFVRRNHQKIGKKSPKNWGKNRPIYCQGASITIYRNVADISAMFVTEKHFCKNALSLTLIRDWEVHYESGSPWPTKLWRSSSKGPIARDWHLI